MKFDSSRRMMSNLVASPEGRLFLFTKGADSAILPLIADQDDPAFNQTLDNIEKYAEQGLRTLVFAYKELNMMSDDFELIGMTD